MSRDILNELDHLMAKQAACEAILMHVTVPLLVASGPELARELLENIRSDFVVRSPAQREQVVLMTEEYLARLADGIEARVRSKTDPRR